MERCRRSRFKSLLTLKASWVTLHQSLSLSLNDLTGQWREGTTHTTLSSRKKSSIQKMWKITKLLFSLNNILNNNIILNDIILNEMHLNQLPNHFWKFMSELVGKGDTNKPNLQLSPNDQDLLEAPFCSFPLYHLVEKLMWSKIRVFPGTAVHTWNTPWEGSLGTIFPEAYEVLIGLLSKMCCQQGTLLFIWKFRFPVCKLITKVGWSWALNISFRTLFEKQLIASLFKSNHAKYKKIKFWSWEWSPYLYTALQYFKILEYVMRHKTSALEFLF